MCMLVFGKITIHTPETYKINNYGYKFACSLNRNVSKLCCKFTKIVLEIQYRATGSHIQYYCYYYVGGKFTKIWSCGYIDVYYTSYTTVSMKFDEEESY